MATTAPATLTIEQYLRTSYSPDVDFVDDHTEERNLGEADHAEIQSLIAAMLIRDQRRCAVLTRTEQRIRVAPGRVRICDVCLVQAGVPREPVTTTPPVVCIEILSPEDRLPRAERVMADYSQMGVRDVWLIDPLRRVAYTYGDGGIRLHDHDLLHASTRDVSLSLTELFDALDNGGF